jgi:hypothetical protein
MYGSNLYRVYHYVAESVTAWLDACGASLYFENRERT